MRHAIIYPYPMRDYRAQFVLPDDLTAEEIAKIKAFLDTLAVEPVKGGE